MSSAEVAVIVGVGPGLGLALVEACAAAGMKVAMAARSEDKLQAMRPNAYGDNVRAYATDAGEPKSVGALFEAVERDLGDVTLAVFNAGAFQPGSILDISPEDFERCWRVGTLGGLLVGQEAARRMVGRGSGSIIFTGATAALRGSANFVNLAAPKFGLRAVAQSMARELGPKGIHVAHVVVDGQIESDRYRHLLDERGPDTLMKPEDLAANYLHLHNQPRNCWTLELDVRPWAEKF